MWEPVPWRFLPSKLSRALLCTQWCPLQNTQWLGEKEENSITDSDAEYLIWKLQKDKDLAGQVLSWSIFLFIRFKNFSECYWFSYIDFVTSSLTEFFYYLYLFFSWFSWIYYIYSFYIYTVHIYKTITLYANSNCLTFKFLIVPHSPSFLSR